VERLRQLVQQIEHADEIGLDAFGVGEHHRREFLDSAPAVILVTSAREGARQSTAGCRPSLRPCPDR
jgi:alkanesulfonate monooxygenase SsuD/methylene tetrahydromethanopterin reductase-like flavin-dependent oxidoreductase (luciferase family)